MALGPAGPWPAWPLPGRALAALWPLPGRALARPGPVAGLARALAGLALAGLALAWPEFLSFHNPRNS